MPIPSKFIEVREILAAHCGRELKYGAPRPGETEDEKVEREARRACHLGLLQLEDRKCASCRWLTLRKVPIRGIPLLIQREVNLGQVTAEYKNLLTEAHAASDLQGKAD